VFVTTDPIDLAALLTEARPGDGALCLFVGVVRNESDGRETLAIDYEAYGPMAESEMARIAKEVSDEWPGARLRVRHRVGRLEVGDATPGRHLARLLAAAGRIAERREVEDPNSHGGMSLPFRR